MAHKGNIFLAKHDYPSESLPIKVEKLCLIEARKHRWIVSSAVQQNPISTRIVKPVKEAAFDALFQQSKAAKDFPRDLLQSNEWTLRCVVSAVAFRMRTNQRRFYDADNLEKLSDQIIGENLENTRVLRFLLHLSDIDNYRQSRRELFKVPTSEDIRKIIRRKCPIQSGDFPFKIFNPSYTLCDFRAPFRKDDPIMYPQLDKDKKMDMLHASQFETPELSLHEKRNGLFGFRSKFFSHQSLTDSAYEVDSQTRLYGGLRHSRTFELDIKMSYPKLTSPINLLSSVATDEGFVSPSSSLISSDSDWGVTEPVPTCHQDIPMPYFDYKPPKHDLNLWKDCLSHEMRHHRTWETLGLPAGATERRLYLSEAGSKVFDIIWKQRASLIHDLSDFFDGVPSSKVIWEEFNEDHLVKCSSLVAMGVPSDVFQFNVLAQIFLPRKDIYFCGVDPAAVFSSLHQFSKWGTCYRRLLQFSGLSLAYGDNLQISVNIIAERGAIFNAFVSAVRRYLREYLNQLIALKYGGLSLQGLAARMRKAGNQIEYIARLCMCGEADLPVVSLLPLKDFPTGIQLLSYLHEEALHQPDSCNYLVLLYILRKSCVPYLQFIRNWIFRGHCQDIHGEFMLRVNVDYGGSRKDRQRWKKHIEPIRPDDPGSCVPSFLSSLASDMYTCGRTISLMQSVCPSHFLVVDGADVPSLEITFSKRKLQETENDWARHRTKMIQLEKQLSVHWMLVEEAKKAAAQKEAAAARKAAKDGLIKMQQALRADRRINAEAKQKELRRLKKQAEDAAAQRSQAREAEKEEDKMREENRLIAEKKADDERDRIEKEEKDKIISYYDDLNREADRKIRKANWSKKRGRLNEERLRFLLSDGNYWREQLQGEARTTLQGTDNSSAGDRASESNFLEAECSRSESDLDLALRAIGSKIREIDSAESHLSRFTSDERQNHARPLRKAVSGSHVSQTTASVEPSVVQFRKRVDGKGISLTSYDDDDVFTADTLRPVRKPVSGESILSSSIDTVMKPDTESSNGNTQITNTGKTLKKSVAGQNIASSNVGFIMNPGESLNSAYGNFQITNSIRTLKKQVSGQSATSSSLTGNGYESDLLNQQITNSTKTLKKSVAGRNVTDSSVAQLLEGVPTQTEQDCSSTRQKTFKKSVPGKDVSLSSMGSILKDTPTEISSEQQHLSKKQVHGQSVSASSVGELLSDQTTTAQSLEDVIPVKTGKKPVTGKHVSSSSMVEMFATLPTTEDGAFELHRKKKIAGRNVSDSAVLECMRLDPLLHQEPVPNQLIDKLERFNATNKFHGKHHSQSTVGGLLYYDDTVPWNEQKVAGNTKTFRAPVNSAKRHPSFSTVQLLMYRDVAIQEEDQVVDSPQETFHLQLPAVFEYAQPKITAIGTPISGDAIGEPVDLMKDISNSHPEDDLGYSGVDADSIHMQLLPALLRKCVVRPISQQIALANRCVMNHFMTKLNLLHHFEMMRRFCFMEDGEFGQILCDKLFEKMHSCRDPGDFLNPVILESMICQAVQGSSQRNAPDARRLTFSLSDVPATVSARDPASLDCFAIKYDIGWPWNIVITEANHARYGQVFGFLLRLKRVMWALNDVTRRLLPAGEKWMHLSARDLHRLRLYRHEMQNFVKVMQGYVSTQVVHACWHEFAQALKGARRVDELHDCHVEYLRKCRFRCLLTKKTKMVMSVITDIFKTILRFWTQLFSKSVKFAELKVTYTNFSKYSGFLVKVVSKLVDHGYQPSLEDFLLRLNFNGFYCT